MYTCFQLVPKSITSDDLEQPMHSLAKSPRPPSWTPNRPVSRRRFSPSPADSVLSRRQPTHIV